jgi:hypothetical protein
MAALCLPFAATVCVTAVLLLAIGGVIASARAA